MQKKMILTGCTALCMAFGLMALNQYFTGGYEIVAEGKTLGIVTDEAQYETALSAVNQQLSVDFGDAAQLEPDVQMKSCLIPKNQVTSQWELYENIASMSDYMAESSTLVIDGKKTISFRSEADLKKALSFLRDKFSVAGGQSGIQESITIDTEYISVADLYSAEDGADYLEECGLIHVFSVVETEYKITMPFQTIEQEDSQVYAGEREVIQEGVPGEALVRAKIEYMNGVETANTVLSETVKREAVNEIVSVGTKPKPDGMGTGTFAMPASGRISSEFGPRWGRTHTGIDIAAPSGSEIRAADTGIVSFSGQQGSYGNLVKIDHQNGYVTYYAHCSKLLAEPGQVVEKGELIALVGSTGNSTGPHCHFEVRSAGQPQDPFDFVKP